MVAMVKKLSSKACSEFEPEGDAHHRHVVGEVVLRCVGVGIVALDGVGRDLCDGGGRFRAGDAGPGVAVYSRDGARGRVC